MRWPAPVPPPPPPKEEKPKDPAVLLEELQVSRPSNPYSIINK